MLERGIVLRNRYRMVQPIGQGGMGSVYLAEDTRLEGRKCAIKAVRIDPAAGQEIISELQHQFSREASVLARLDHPNLPKVSDYFTEAAQDYLVMDYVSGKDLKEIVDEARRNSRFLTEMEVLNWARQLCDALDYMHNQETPVLHRDIKPSNIKLTPSGLIKLVDFGLVKVLVKDDSRTITVLQGRGTAAYTPLEQYGEDDTHTDARSDIYSLGATLYHLLTNQAPPEAKQRFLKPESLISPRAINSAISEPVERAIATAISMHPDDRPSTVAEFRDLLFSDHNSDGSAYVPIAYPKAAVLDLVRDNVFWIILAGVTMVVGFLATVMK
ncbi:MAG: serine/threonine protein kinase [Chloroflexi bacterium]|nr:serine/threonine protein kinase [Chloroflexota bacterium]MCL5273372.1 serine/threonine protein kinase [Chloroflexota bacterium]